MRQRHLMWPVALALVALAAVGVIGASAAPAQTPGNDVTQWNLIAATTLVAIPGPAGGAPPAAQINMGMVQGAVYDAVNAIAGPKYRKPYLLKRRFAPTSSKRAAAVTALDQLGVRGLTQRFAQLARDDQSRSVRRAAMAALGRAGESSAGAKDGQ